MATLEGRSPLRGEFMVLVLRLLRDCDFAPGQKCNWHSASMNSSCSCVRSARCFSHCHRRVSSSISASLEAEETMSAVVSETRDFLGDANSSSSPPPGGSGMRPSAAILATSSFLARVL